MVVEAGGAVVGAGEVVEGEAGGASVAVVGTGGVVAGGVVVGGVVAAPARVCAAPVVSRPPTSNTVMSAAKRRNEGFRARSPKYPDMVLSLSAENLSYRCRRSGTVT